jgi:hypothetical protein
MQAQTVATELECILVARSRKDVTRASVELEGMAYWQIVETERLESWGAAKAAGVWTAKAPLVAFIEDHSYPHKDWAEAFLKTHRRGNYAAVGPVVLNANPKSNISWGCFLVYYGMYMWARPEEDVRHLAANHSCYRREVLLNYGPRLPDMLEAEIVLHGDLLAKGYKLVQEPTAMVYHINYSRLGPTLNEYYMASRVFAAERAEDWRHLRKIVYALGSPLLPLIRQRRILADARRAGLDKKTLWWPFIPMMLTLCAGAMGEMLGYAIGAGCTKSRLIQFEKERDGTVTPCDL